MGRVTVIATSTRYVWQRNFPSLPTQLLLNIYYNITKAIASILQQAVNISGTLVRMETHSFMVSTALSARRAFSVPRAQVICATVATT